MATALNYRCKWIDNYPFLKLSDWPINITAKTVQTKMYPHINKARELQKASPFTAPIRSTSLAIIFVALWYCSLCTASLSQWWSVDQLPLFCSQSVDWLGWVWLHHIYLFYFHVSTFLGFVQYQPGGNLTVNYQMLCCPLMENTTTCLMRFDQCDNIITLQYTLIDL